MAKNYAVTKVIRISPEDAELLQAKAVQLGVSEASVFRMALKLFVVPAKQKAKRA